MGKERLPVGLVTLGCAKNQVDSEYMLSELEDSGFTLTEDFSRAVAIVVNTCGFIQPAKEESIETILEAARYKETGCCRVLAVVGCLAERYRAELEKELPEVDIFIGLGEDQRRLGPLLCQALGARPQAPGKKTFSPRLVRTAAQGWAYLKISEGCDNRCSYCAIPLIRGSLASRPERELVEEARYLESLGVIELNLIAQDVTAYGMERKGQASRLAGLLELLLTETSIPWIRLLYLHPAHLERRLLELIAGNSRLLPYLDIPIQHASDRMLARMGRKVTRNDILRTIELARTILKNPVLRTTVLVGFPGETRRDFRELIEFIQAVRFDRLGGFVYSREEGTAAYALRGRLSRAERERRLGTVLQIQREISAVLNAGRVGQVLPVLVERALDPGEAPSAEYRWSGRSQGHAPEVDGWVYVQGEKLAPGSLAEVRITESGDYDLFGIAIE